MNSIKLEASITALQDILKHIKEEEAKRIKTRHKPKKEEKVEAKEEKTEAPKDEKTNDILTRMMKKKEELES